MNQSQGLRLEKAPQDTVSDLDFCGKEPLLVAASWDNTVRIWRSNDRFATNGQQVLCINDATKDAVLRCCFKSNDTTVFYGSARGRICQITPEASQSTTIGEQTGIITGLKWSASNNVIVTGSADFTCQWWDPRSGKTPQRQINLPEKCIALDVAENIIYIAMTKQRLGKIDMKNPTVMSEKTELKTQLTSIGLAPRASAHIVGCVSGMVEIRMGNNTLCLLEHKSAPESAVYPVTAVKMSPDKRGAMSAGGDGKIATYRLDNGKKTSEKAITPSKAPVTALALGHDLVYAAAVGYDWSQGVDKQQKEQPDIYVRRLNTEFG